MARSFSSKVPVSLTHERPLEANAKLRSILPILKPFALPDSPPTLAFEKKRSSGVGTPGPFLGNEVSVRRILGVVVPTVTLRMRISVFTLWLLFCGAGKRRVCLCRAGLGTASSFGSLSHGEGSRVRTGVGLLSVLL